MRIQGKVVSLVAGALALAATAGLSIPASAAKSAEAAVIVTNPVVVGVCWVQDNCGDSTAYNFTSASCTGIDGGLPAPCSAAANGSFTNVACGTGTLIGNTASITEADGSTNATTGTTATTGMDIVFVGGAGVLLAPSMANSTEGTTGSAAGVVQIRPNSATPTGLELPPSLNGECTTGFVVTAVVAGAL